jgi:hypothetical protein
MGVGVFDDRVEVAQAIAAIAGDLGPGEVVEDRLVVLVHQHDHALAVLGMGPGDQLAQAARRVVGVAAGQAQALGVLGQQRADAPVQLGAVLRHAAAEAQADDRKAPAPVPVRMGIQTAEQGLVALEQLGEGVEQQRLAEAARAREEVVAAALDQAQGEAGLVDVVAVVLADLAEGLDADGQALAGHGLGSGAMVTGAV